MSKSLDLLFFKALKQAAKSTRQYEPTLNRKTRVPADLRSRIKQRAKWETMEMPKRTGQYAYVKYEKIAPGQFGYKGFATEYISQLTKADVKKWEKLYFEPHLLANQKIGKIVFQKYQDTWHHYPVDEQRGTSAVHISTAASDIIHHLAINIESFKHHPASIKREIERAFGDKPNDMRHYKALVAESNRTGMPQHYKDDLIKHDKRALSYRDPSLPFGWVLRTHGTHIIDPLELWDGKLPGASVKSYLSTFEAEKTALYAWDGARLIKKSPEQMTEWLDSQYKSHQRLNRE
jgi:hypothetical protein